MFTRANLTKLIADLANKPTLNADQLKAYFDNSPLELKEAINLLEQELEATTAAGQIGASPLNEFSGSNIQAILQYLKGQIDNVALGTIPDNSLTTQKMATEQKRGVAGGVASLDEAGNVPLAELGNVVTPWEKISEITLTDNPAQVDFLNIPSGYKKFKLQVSVKNASNTTADNLVLKFNDDNTNSYSYNFMYTQSGGSYSYFANYSVSSLTLGPNSLPTFAGEFNLISIEIQNFSNAIKNLILHSIKMVPGTFPVTIVGGGYWQNKINEINKISFVKSGGGVGIATGSTFVLWGAK